MNECKDITPPRAEEDWGDLGFTNEELWDSPCSEFTGP